MLGEIIWIEICGLFRLDLKHVMEKKTRHYGYSDGEFFSWPVQSYLGSTMAKSGG